jgi:MFS family permease
MHDALPILARGIAAPAAVSLVVALLLGRFASGAWRRYVAAIAFAAGFCAGVALIRPWDELLPSRHWQWMFYLSLAAAVVGPISAAAGLHRIERWLLLALTALVAAWLLVPTWESLQPPRLAWVPLLAGYLFLLAAALEPMARLLPPRNLLGLLMLSAADSAALVAAAVSLTYGLPAAAAAAALLGCSAALLLSADADHVRGVIPAYAAVVGGWAFVGCVDPQVPMPLLLLAPAAPLALWCCAWGPLAKLKGAGAMAVQATAVVAVLAAAAWLALA